MFAVLIIICALSSAVVDPAPPPSPSFDFDLMAPASTVEAPPPALNPGLANQATLRRSMLNTHQILGLSTLGLMAATVVLGQLNYNDMYTHDGGHTGDFRLPKAVLGYATTAAFMTTAGFSLFAPTPVDKPDRGVDTATLHKVLVSLASAGIVTQVVLGFITGRTADAGNPEHIQTLAKAHQVVGYSTFALFGSAAAIWIF